MAYACLVNDSLIAWGSASFAGASPSREGLGTLPGFPLQRQDAGADEVGEAFALIFVEQRVHPAQRAGHRVSQALGGRDAVARGLLGTRLVERVTPDRVGERRQRP